jgi:ATP-dependent protease ClpP protease subunit
MAPVVQVTADALIRAIDQKLSKNIDRLHVMLSSPGGSVFHGLSIHNMLKASPVPVTTYNFGSVDSIGVVIFCAGSSRVCVPHARFLIHGVSMGLQANSNFDEQELEEKLKLLRSDYGNIARVISDTTGKAQKDVVKKMNQRTTLTPEDALSYGLVSEIRSQLFPEGSDMTMIYENGSVQELTMAPRQLPLPSTIAQQAASAPMDSPSPQAVSEAIPESCSTPYETGTYFPWTTTEYVA